MQRLITSTSPHCVEYDIDTVRHSHIIKREWVFCININVRVRGQGVFRVWSNTYRDYDIRLRHVFVEPTKTQFCLVFYGIFAFFVYFHEISKNKILVEVFAKVITRCFIGCSFSDMEVMDNLYLMSYSFCR